MKILVIADIESKYLWDYYEKEKLDGIDLIISCGDLRPQYLSFLATFAKVPILYVRGNHDECYETTSPDGCICIEDQVYVHDGMRILGLGGSMRYKKGNNQYTQKEMMKRANSFSMRRKIKKAGGVDILVTHAPAFELRDGDDMPHQGFQAFNLIMDKYEPQYFFHGHVHVNYGLKFVREYQYKNTKIINAYERYIIEI